MRQMITKTAAVVALCLLGCFPLAAQSQTSSLSKSITSRNALETSPAPTSLFDSTSKKIAQQGSISKQNDTVKVNPRGLIDLHVKELEIAQVIQLLSLQSQRNIVASRNVAGMISADLYGVDFYEALDAVLHTNGLGYREKGNFIYVYTQDELALMEKAEKRLTHRVYHLNYLTSKDASKFVTPLLSSDGSLAINTDPTDGFEPSVDDGGANSFAHTDILLIRDYSSNIDEIVAVLKDLDTRPKQVLVEATVLKTELTENNAFGVDLTVVADFAFTEFNGGPTQAIKSLITGSVTGTAQAFQTTVGDTTNRFGARVGIISDNIAAFIKALDEVVDTTVLSHPKILVLNRQRAKILIGQRLGYLSSTATETSTTQTVKFLDVGTQLTVRPFISDDGFIRMELTPSVSTGTTEVTQGIVIPQEDTQELTTNVMVQNGQTVVLGGLFKEETVVNRKQVPGLGDIPLLGAAFQGRDDQVTRSEVIFLITPTILKDQLLYATGERMKNKVAQTRLGARQGLLPWSRSKLTAGYMRQAMQYYENNDHARALWAANMALRLDSHLIEAIELREKITGTREYWPSRNLLSEAVNEIVREQLQRNEPSSAK